MRLDPNDMLRKLGSGVRPAGADTGTAAGKTPVDAQGFSELLSAAKSGAISGTSPVKLAKGSKAELTPEQLQRLGPAVDAAEAAGVGRLLAIIDGRAYSIDVRSRTVEGRVSAKENGLISGIDAVAMIPPAAQSAPGSLDAGGALGAGSAPPTAQLVALPSSESIRNASLAELLARSAAA